MQLVVLQTLYASCEVVHVPSNGSRYIWQYLALPFLHIFQQVRKVPAHNNRTHGLCV